MSARPSASLDRMRTAALEVLIPLSYPSVQQKHVWAKSVAENQGIIGPWIDSGRVSLPRYGPIGCVSVQGVTVVHPMQGAGAPVGYPVRPWGDQARPCR